MSAFAMDIMRKKALRRQSCLDRQAERSRQCYTWGTSISKSRRQQKEDMEEEFVLVRMWESVCQGISDRMEGKTGPVT